MKAGDNDTKGMIELLLEALGKCGGDRDDDCLGDDMDLFGQLAKSYRSTSAIDKTANKMVCRQLLSLVVYRVKDELIVQHFGCTMTDVLQAKHHAVKEYPGAVVPSNDIVFREKTSRALLKQVVEWLL